MSARDIERTLMQGSIAALCAHYLKKEISVTDAVDWFLKRIASVSQNRPAINAVREVSGRALEDGKVLLAEVHWYEAHGIGRKEFKIKRYIDQ